MISLLSSALLTVSLVSPIASDLPKLNIEATCKASVRLMADPQGPTVHQCISDEMSAQKIIESQWSQYAPNLRIRCVAETEIGGGPSYVDVLECLQIGSNKPPL
jgi:hypothetical protein